MRTDGRIITQSWEGRRRVYLGCDWCGDVFEVDDETVRERFCSEECEESERLAESGRYVSDEMRYGVSRND